jgi:hypothetical protein
VSFCSGISGWKNGNSAQEAASALFAGLQHSGVLVIIGGMSASERSQKDRAVELQKGDIGLDLSRNRTSRNTNMSRPGHCVGVSERLCDSW